MPALPPAWTQVCQPLNGRSGYPAKTVKMGGDLLARSVLVPVQVPALVQRLIVLVLCVLYSTSLPYSVQAADLHRRLLTSKLVPASRPIVVIHCVRVCVCVCVCVCVRKSLAATTDSQLRVLAVPIALQGAF
jgi:hypothetical protein